MAFTRLTLLAVLALVAVAPLYGQEPLPEDLPAPAETPLSGEPQFENGKPQKFVDSVGWVFGIPKKVILWDRRAVNHNVSADTEQRLADYINDNGLGTTKVRINQYDPVGEWQRLRANKDVGAGWRYTVGAFGAISYTLIPGRLFGKDRYNPYTDSIYIYSDIPCITQEQAAYAKLVRSHAYPGTYATLTYLPVVQLWPEKQSKDDVLDYTLASGTPDQHSEATRIFYAEFGAEVGGQASLFLGSNLPLTLAGAGVGHVTARLKPDASPESPPEETPDVELTAREAPEVDAATLTR